MIHGEALFDLANHVFGQIDRKQIGPTSVDVTVDDLFWEMTNPEESLSIDLSNIPSEDKLYRKRVVGPEGFEMLPKEFIKARTAEVFYMPDSVVGMFSLRSCIAQAGLEQSTSVWVRPSWTGQLILELCNFSNKLMIVRPGLLIGQIHFFDLTKLSYEDIRMICGDVANQLISERMKPQHILQK